MIKIRNLSFSYKAGEKPVLNQIHTTIPAGRLITILGANGAGKTTLFKCMLGFLKQYEGEILLEGKEIRTLRRKEIAKQIAYIPQSESPVYNYTVFDSVLMGTTGSLSPLGSPKEEQRKVTEEALTRLGIEHLAQRGINEISGGERQLTLLARAMAQRANTLIMDEPTANLDYGNQQMVMNQITAMTKEGYTILLSTHNPEHALQYATHVLAIKDSHIIADGEVQNTLDEDLIEQIYGIKVRITETNINGKIVRSCIPI